MRSRDIVFLFGAGASFGAGDILPERPPLGGQLYQRLSECFPSTWGNMPSDIKRTFQQLGFESGMEIIYRDYGTAIAPLMREMAIYLVQLRPYSGQTVYGKLVDKLISRNELDRVIFSTQNYDCVLEFELINRNIPIDYFAQDFPTTLPVWKLHGSANWFAKDIRVGEDVQFGPGVVFGGGLQAWLDMEKVIETCLVNQGLYPCMALYMRGKPVQISPDAVQDIQARWKAMIASAQLVIVAGVNPLPEDNHIWEPLANTDAELLFIGDQRAFQTWTRTYRKKSHHYLAPFFSNGLYYLIQYLGGQ
jgi:hypothetical protein